MKTDVNVIFKVPAQAYTILEMIAEQNKQVEMVCMGGGEILIAANLLDFPNYSDDGGWDEINEFLEGRE